MKAFDTYQTSTWKFKKHKIKDFFHFYIINVKRNTRAKKKKKFTTEDELMKRKDALR